MWQPSKVAEIATRIDEREEGLTVHLKPDTARIVAPTMRLYDAGRSDLRDSASASRSSTSEPHEVLAYCTNANLAIGAWEAYARQYPNRNLIATWGGWITRGCPSSEILRQEAA